MNGFMNGYNNNLPPQTQGFGYAGMNYNYIQSQPQQPTNNGIYTEFRFMNEDEFKAQVVNPNCRLYALDKEKMKFYVKVTDSLGNTSIDRFSLSKESDTAQSVVTETISKDDLKGFVTTEDFNTQISALKGELDKKFNQINKSIKIKNIISEGEENA